MSSLITSCSLREEFSDKFKLMIIPQYNCSLSSFSSSSVNLYCRHLHHHRNVPIFAFLVATVHVKELSVITQHLIVISLEAILVLEGKI